MACQDDIKTLIIDHNRRLQKLKEQQARKGIDTEPYILIEIEDIEIELEKLQTKLQELQEVDEVDITTVESPTEKTTNQRGRKRSRQKNVKGVINFITKGGTVNISEININKPKE